MSCDGECKANKHPGGVMLYGSINEFFHARKGHNFIQLTTDISILHSQDCPVHEYVFSSAQFRVKAGAYFQQRANLS